MTKMENYIWCKSWIYH